MNFLVYYHCFLFLGEPPIYQPQAVDIIADQMSELMASGLEAAASEIHVGINGTEIESAELARLLFPMKAQIVYHGLGCRNENRTIQMIENRLKDLTDEAYVCYFMAKGASFPAGDSFRTRWRNRMGHHVVTDWRMCVEALDVGAQACGCHWLTPEAYPGLVGHPYFGGTFWWARASYLKTLPSISDSPAVKAHGLDAFEARYEAESWIGHGPRRPAIKDFHPGWPS